MKSEDGRKIAFCVADKIMRSRGVSRCAVASYEEEWVGGGGGDNSSNGGGGGRRSGERDRDHSDMTSAVRGERRAPHKHTIVLICYVSTIVAAMRGSKSLKISRTSYLNGL